MAIISQFNCGPTRADVIRAVVAADLNYNTVSNTTNAYYGTVGADTYYFYTGSATATSADIATGTDTIDLILSCNGMRMSTPNGLLTGSFNAAVYPALPDANGVKYFYNWTPTLAETNTRTSSFQLITSVVDGSSIEHTRLIGFAFLVDGYWRGATALATVGGTSIHSGSYLIEHNLSSATKADLIASLQAAGFALESTNQSILIATSATKELASSTNARVNLISTGTVDLSEVALEATNQSILAYTSSTNERVNILPSSTSVDLSGLALEATSQTILALASATNIKVDNIPTTSTVDLSGLALESTLQSVYSLSSSTNIKVDNIQVSATVDLSPVLSALSATESSIVSNFSGLALESTLQAVYGLASSSALLLPALALESTLQTVYSLASATKLLASGSAKESTLQAVYLLASGSALIIPSLALQTTVSNILSVVSGTNTNVQFVYDYHQGGMKIDINTGVITHYKSDNATELLKYQMLDNLYASTTDPGSSFGRRRV